MNRIHEWEVIDPQIFGKGKSMADLARQYGIPHRQITNRKYHLRDKAQRLFMAKKRKDLREFLIYLNVKSIKEIPFLGSKKSPGTKM